MKRRFFAAFVLGALVPACGPSDGDPNLSELEEGDVSTQTAPLVANQGSSSSSSGSGSSASKPPPSNASQGAVVPGTVIIQLAEAPAQTFRQKRGRGAG